MSQSVKQQRQEDVDTIDTEALTDEILLSLTTETLAEYLTLTPDNTTQSEDVLHLLTYASVQQLGRSMSSIGKRSLPQYCPQPTK